MALSAPGVTQINSCSLDIEAQGLVFWHESWDLWVTSLVS